MSEPQGFGGEWADYRFAAKEDYRLFRMGLTGSFMTALFTAIQHADQGNLELLRKGFPHEVAVCRGEP